MALMANIVEPFTGTTTPTGWTQFTGGSATFTYNTTGAQVNFPASTTSSTDGDINFTATNDLTGSFARLNVLSVPGAGATHTDAVFRVRQNSTNYVTIFYEAGTLFFSKVVASAQTNVSSIAYNATNHAWWQIRESGGNTFWETSADGNTWTIQTSQANAITFTAVDLLIGGLCFGVDATPSPFKFRYFNYPQYGTTTSTSFTTSTSSTSSSISSTSTSISSTSASSSTSSTSNSTSSTSSSISSTSSSTSSTSASSTSSSTSISSTSSSISSTSQSSTSRSSTSSSSSISSTSSSISSTSSSISSTSRSTSSTSFSSTSSSSSTSTTAIPIGQNYRYEDDNILDTDNTNLDNPMTTSNVSDLDGDDGDYFIEYGSKYMMKQFKKKNVNNSDAVTFTWKGRSTYDTRQSPFYIQVYNNQTSSGIVDSYSETNQNISFSLNTNSSDFTGTSQSFTGTGANLSSSQFYLKKTGLPTGNAVAKIYAHSGTFGTSSVPTGTALATSDNFDVSTLTTSYVLTSLVFSGINMIALTNGTKYVVSLEYSTGDASNRVDVGCDNSVPSHAGNLALNGGSWIAQSGIDLCFYVNGSSTVGWEALARETRIPADVDFQLKVTQSSNMSNYYDSNNIITFRTYQQVI